MLSLGIKYITIKATHAMVSTTPQRELGIILRPSNEWRVYNLTTMCKIHITLILVIANINDQYGASPKAQAGG